ncbi:hypothetical protein TARUN_5183 [Trichoderma arundinaceum]|uniref:Uncharacterized protein n=1 Tax=Trichoderma arundinaceum TaxID=490622 RepID=A0A395NMI2_TRIAR|nr:hypothetical protein TARUN_5183 [Trichoderma arundinaceum]
MASTTDHGGLYYAELIKSNLQYINGPQASIHVLTQLMEETQAWQVSFMKTQNGKKTIALSGEGGNLVDVLQEMHRKSAGMLGVYFTEQTASTKCFNKCIRAEIEAEAAAAFTSAKASEALKTEREYDVKTGEVFLTILNSPRAAAKEVPETADAPQKSSIPSSIPSSVPSSVPSLTNGSSDSESSSDEIRLLVDPWRSKPLPEDPVAAKTDGGRRSIICPNYGPVRSFPRVFSCDEKTGEATLIRERRSTKKQGKDKAGPSKAQQLEKPAPASGLEGKSQQGKFRQGQTVPVRLDSLSPPVRLQIERQLRAHQRSQDLQTPAKVMMQIQWDGFGQMVVADECRLSARVVQDRVREMLRDHGASLFGNAKGRVIPPNLFAPEELHKFTTVIKRMEFGKTSIMLGPEFGDDLASMTGGQKPAGFVGLDIDLQWHGEQQLVSDTN